MNYGVHYTVTKWAAISDEEAKKVALQVLVNITDIPNDAFIEAGVLYGWEEHCGHNREFETKKIRTATAEDKVIIDLYYKLKG